MAITPKEALGSKAEQRAKRKAKLTQIFDSNLRRKFEGRGTVSVAVPHEFDTAIVEDVLESYRSAGWDAQLQPCTEERDTTYHVNFSKAKGIVPPLPTKLAHT